MGVYLPLPSAYQQVEYIESASTGSGQSSSGQYFTVGNSFKTSYKVVIDFQMTVIGGDYIPVGIHYNNNSNVNVRYGIDCYSSKIQVNGGGNWTTTITEDTNRHTITINKNTATVDGTNYTINYTDYTFSQGIGVFCYNEYHLSQYNYKSSNKLYKLDIYDENGNHINDLVPCYRKADSVIGMYDLVNNQFYTNSGTGTFSKGADVTAVPLKNAYIGEVHEYVYDFQNNGSLNWTATTIGYGTPDFVTGQGWRLYRSSNDSQAGIMPPSSVYTGELKKIKISFHKGIGTYKSGNIYYAVGVGIADSSYSQSNGFMWSFTGVTYDNIRYDYSGGYQRIQTANFTGEATVEADFSNTKPVVSINGTSYTLTNGDSSIYKGYWTSGILQIGLGSWNGGSGDLYVRKVEITTE